MAMHSLTCIYVYHSYCMDSFGCIFLCTHNQVYLYDDSPIKRNTMLLNTLKNSRHGSFKLVHSTVNNVQNVISTHTILTYVYENTPTQHVVSLTLYACMRYYQTSVRRMCKDQKSDKVPYIGVESKFILGGPNL